MIRETLVAPSLKPSTGSSANHLADCCPSFKVLWWNLGFNLRFMPASAFRSTYVVCDLVHLQQKTLKLFELDTLLIPVWMTNINIFLLDWKLLEAQGWIILENICISAEWLGFTFIVVWHFSLTILKQKPRGEIYDSRLIYISFLFFFSLNQTCEKKVQKRKNAHFRLILCLLNKKGNFSPKCGVWIEDKSIPRMFWRF